MVEAQKHILFFINQCCYTTAVGGSSYYRNVFTLTAKRSSLWVMYIMDMETDEIKYSHGNKHRGEAIEELGDEM